MSRKRLVIAPHVDDDVIGCGGILDEDTVVFYCGVDDYHRVDKAQRNLEAMAVQKSTGHLFFWPNGFSKEWRKVIDIEEREVQYPCERNVNEYDFESLKDDFECLISIIQPEEILFPWPSYNQDHQTVYAAAMVATRPHDENHFIKRVLLYEEPDCLWGEQFRPNLYRQIDIIRKLELYNLMPSQIRGHRHPEHIKALATIRGAASGYAAAEAYHILRWIE